MCKKIYPFISVIVPVYNAEKTLNRCIDSILASEYKKFELILVDDGSKDLSGSICDDYAIQNANVKVIHQENQGVSVARNKGIELTQGEWLAFADADDTVKPQYLGAMAAALDDDFQGLIIQGIEKWSNGQSEILTLPAGIYQNEKIGPLFEDGLMLSLGFPFSKLYRRSIVMKHGIRFDKEIHMCEDLLFLLKYLTYVQEIRVLPECGYQYYFENNTASSKYYSFESELSCYQKIQCQLQELSRKFSFKFSPQIKKSLGIPLFRPILALYFHSRYSFQERMQKLDAFLQSERQSVLDYYSPGLIQFRVAQKLLFFSTRLFDLYMQCILWKHH